MECILSLVLLALLCTATNLQDKRLSDPEMIQEDSYRPEDSLTSAVVKRGMKAVPYPCNGYDFLPRCLHGGRGPHKTWTKTGQYCVCLCPAKWQGPECSYAADNLLGKRAYEEEKRYYP